MNAKILIVVFAFCLFLAGALYDMFSYRVHTPPQLGSSLKSQKSTEIAPDFSFTDLKNIDHSLHDFKGTPILLNFWATWCPPCIEEIPYLFELAEHNPDDLNIVMISVDHRDVNINAFLQKIAPEMKEKLKLDNIFIGRDPDLEISGGQYQVHKYPESFLINEELFIEQKILSFDALKKINF